jgi:hypothetical protein
LFASALSWKFSGDELQTELSPHDPLKMCRFPGSAAKRAVDRQVTLGHALQREPVREMRAGGGAIKCLDLPDASTAFSILSIVRLDVAFSITPEPERTVVCRRP